MRRRDKLNAHMRPVTVLEAVKQVSGMLWPYLFGKQPDSLQRDDEVRAPGSRSFCQPAMLACDARLPLPDLAPCFPMTSSCLFRAFSGCPRVRMCRHVAERG